MAMRASSGEGGAFGKGAQSSRCRVFIGNRNLRLLPFGGRDMPGIIFEALDDINERDVEGHDERFDNNADQAERLDLLFCFCWGFEAPLVIDETSAQHRFLPQQRIYLILNSKTPTPSKLPFGEN